jgi:methylenetetrahydrofolate dehydrogenase (NADP+)/methenyltetrahydrofolate cyclohydrolase
MNTTIVNGTALAADIRARVKAEVAKITASGGRVTFAAIIVGDNPASRLYIEKKQKACLEVGIEMRTIALAGTTSQDKLERIIAKLSHDKSVHGILLQLPLPAPLDPAAAIERIAPNKDVDGLTAVNFGRLMAGSLALSPCTALGVIHILKSHSVQMAGSTAVVVGRSNIVGRPVAALLLREDATVTVAHSKTKNLSEHTKNADIVVVAAGHTNLITADMIKPGAVVIDVGTNRGPDGKVTGDVDFAAVSKKASIITPVPGGVGPLTIAYLLSNILEAFKGKGTVE